MFFGLPSDRQATPLQIKRMGRKRIALVRFIEGTPQKALQLLLMQMY